MLGTIRNTASPYISKIKGSMAYNTMMFGADITRIRAKGAGNLTSAQVAAAPAVVGAGAGGIYGMFSDDTSVIGGAFKGALAGGGVGAAVNYGIGKTVLGGMRKKGTGALRQTPRLT